MEFRNNIANKQIYMLYLRIHLLKKIPLLRIYINFCVVKYKVKIDDRLNIYGRNGFTTLDMDLVVLVK